MQITIVISTFLDIVLRRRTKVRRFGKDDIQSAFESGPFGVDGNPIAGLRAIYAETTGKGEKVIVGYVNVNQLADVGELRLFSLDSAGLLSTFIWIKNDGTIQLGGAIDNAVKFSPLNSSLGQLVNNLNAELVKIQTAITGLGGTYARGTLTLDISAAKINQIKTP